jgi:uncharacterized protein (AIM24 family)
MTYKQTHAIDYRIYGEEMQCVEIELDPNETAIAESGSFMMMNDGIQFKPFLAMAPARKKVF